MSKESDYIFKLGRRYHKERNAILSSLGITKERISIAHEKQKDNKEKSIEEVECSIIQEELIKQKYAVIFEEEIKVAVDYACQKLSMTENKSLKLMQDILKNMRLFYYLGDEEEEFNITSYRRLYSNSGTHRDYVCSVAEKYQSVNGFELFKEYAHRKVHMLNEYMEIKGITEKI